MRNYLLLQVSDDDDCLRSSLGLGLDLLPFADFELLLDASINKLEHVDVVTIYTFLPSSDWAQELVRLFREGF